MNKYNIFLISISSLFLASCSNEGQKNIEADKNEDIFLSAPTIERKAAPEDATVFFIKPRANERFSGPIEVEFGVSNIEIVPSGQDQQGSGHHHIIIDAELPDMNLPITADKNYVHFGDGSSKTTLNLEPGEHTLQLLLGDYLHIPHEPPIMSEKITVFVD